jgi:hypothetical protein
VVPCPSDVWGADDVRDAELEIDKVLRADPVWPAVPAGPEGQAVADVPFNGRITRVETSPAWPGFVCDQELERGATKAEELGSQTPGVANGVTLHHPPTRLPLEDPSAIAPGCYQREALAEVGAGSATSKAATEAHRKRKRLRVRKDKPATEFVCSACTKDQGRLVSFNCAKDLRRHIRTTKAHNARAVAFCSCGKSVTRRDAMKTHRKYCRSNTPGSPMVGPRRSGTN